MLRTSLCSLSISMPLPRSFLTLSISQRTGHGPSNTAFDSFPNSSAIIPQLALGFLTLALSILALSLLLETVGAYSISDRFFGSADGLVVRALGAIWVVCRYASGWRDGEGTEFAYRVRGIMFGLGSRLLVGCLVLVLEKKKISYIRIKFFLILFLI